MIKKSFLLTDAIKAIDQQAFHLEQALILIEPFLPLTLDKFLSLPPSGLAFLDMMTNRFAKMQDMISRRTFPLILEILKEDAPAFIDKLNRLEKLEYLPSAQWWIELREMRNGLAHDYPSEEKALFQAILSLLEESPKILNYWDTLKGKIQPLI